MAHILAIDDETVILNLYRTALEQLHEVTIVEDSDAGLEILGGGLFDLVLLDISMPGRSGIEVLKEIRRHEHDCAVIIVTVHKGIETVVEAMKAGADDYLTKPFKVAELRHAVERALKLIYLERKTRSLEASLQATEYRDDIVYRSTEMKAVFELLRKAAPTDSSVFLTGESGTGKELAAQFVHEHSAKSDGPLVTVNCAAIPATLLESELFGHEKGAFSGAIERKIGKFELASRGTVFLDEISSLPLNLQSKLLRVLETPVIERVGGTKSIHLDVRWIAATNRDPGELVRQGVFREDLYFRLNVIAVSLHSLRQRPDDIPPLVDHFLEKYAREMKTPALQISVEAYESFMSYGWPGNVRELKNLIERLTVLEPGPVIGVADLPARMILDGSDGSLRDIPDGIEGNYKEAMEEFRRTLILKALSHTNGNQVYAARILGLHRNTLGHHMRNLGIRREEYLER